MKARLRIGMYTSVGSRCGIAKYTEDLIGALNAHADIETIPLRPGCLNPLRQLLAGWRLSRCDIAHVQHTYSFFGHDPLTYTLLTRVLFAVTRAPLVLTAHTVRKPGPTRFDGGIGSQCANAVAAPAWLDVKTFQSADAIIVHAEHHKQQLSARKISPDRIHVISPGVPARVDIPGTSRNHFRARFKIPADMKTVGVLGFLEDSKRYTDVMEAIADLPGHPFLLIAGGPRLASHGGVLGTLKKEAEARGIQGRFVITGYLSESDIPIALEAMDVVVVPYSTDQSMSYSLHRALGQARPVIATDIPTIREIYARGPCLALVPTGEPTALRQTLRRLLEDQEARTHLESEARSYAEHESTQIVAARTLEVYRHIQASY